jgi:hypothetical protein
MVVNIIHDLPILVLILDIVCLNGFVLISNLITITQFIKFGIDNFQYLHYASEIFRRWQKLKCLAVCVSTLEMLQKHVGYLLDNGSIHENKDSEQSTMQLLDLVNRLQ